MLQRAKRERREKNQVKEKSAEEESKRGSDPGKTYIFESSVGLISSKIKGKGNKSDATHVAIYRKDCTYSYITNKQDRELYGQKPDVKSHLQCSVNQLLINIYREQAIDLYKAAACQAKIPFLYECKAAVRLKL